MPTYEYHCATCGKQFDAFQSMRDNAYTTCPQDKCQVEPWGQGTVKRQIGTGAGLIFKGSGFYITDYRSENYKTGAKNDTGSSGSSPSPSASGDTKSAAPKTETPKPSPAAPPTPKPSPGI
jgi:putative FmdB family regulatory protein